MALTKLNSDLKSPTWIYAKAFMFFCIGCLAVGMILMETWSLRISLLLLISIWSFCRLYYFAFYVIEKYVDPDFKFASLTGFVLYLISSRKND